MCVCVCTQATLRLGIREQSNGTVIIESLWGRINNYPVLPAPVRAFNAYVMGNLMALAEPLWSQVGGVMTLIHTHTHTRSTVGSHELLHTNTHTHTVRGPLTLLVICLHVCARAAISHPFVCVRVCVCFAQGVHLPPMNDPSYKTTVDGVPSFKTWGKSKAIQQ